MVVHCFFEQSGTFRDEFRKLGYDSFDYDISDSFGKTDCFCNLFNCIEAAINGIDSLNASLFDDIKQGDLVFAFFL